MAGLILELNKKYNDMYSFNSPTIHVPKALIYEDKRGKAKEVNTLTPTGNLTTRNKTKSIKLVADGDEIYIDESTLKKYVGKPKEVKEKPIKKKKVIKVIEEEPEEEDTGMIDIFEELKKDNEMNNKKKNQKYDEEISRQIEETKTYNSEVNKIKNDPENKILFSQNKKPIVFTKEMNDTFNNINDLMLYLKSGRKTMFKTDKQMKLFNILNSAIRGFQFYPTPERVGEYLKDTIIKDYRSDMRGFRVMDMCAGLGSLSLPLIKNLNQNDSLIMVDINRDFTEILSGLECHNITVKTEDILKTNKSKYYNKCIDVIFSNPPFTNKYYEDITEEEKNKLENWEKKNLGSKKKWDDSEIPSNIKNLIKKRSFGELKEDKYFYLSFLFKALDILENQHTTTEKTLYFICPMTLFTNTTGNTLQKSDIGDLALLNIPKATLNRILKNLDLVDKYGDTEDNEDYFVQCKLIDIIDDFKTIRNGKPTILGIKTGLFEIIPYKNSPNYLIY
jgi:16S rRNA G966 N2-methylase RsmD